MSVQTTATWTCDDCGKSATTSTQTERAPRPDGWGEPGNIFTFDSTDVTGGSPGNLRCDDCRVALAHAKTNALAARHELREDRGVAS